MNQYNIGLLESHDDAGTKDSHTVSWSAAEFGLLAYASYVRIDIKSLLNVIEDVPKTLEGS